MDRLMFVADEGKCQKIKRSTVDMPQGVPVCLIMLREGSLHSECCDMLHCVALCCIVLHCVAVCCSVLQCVALCCLGLPRAALCCSVLRYVSACFSVLQCVTMCCACLVPDTDQRVFHKALD